MLEKFEFCPKCNVGSPKWRYDSQSCLCGCDLLHLSKITGRAARISAIGADICPECGGDLDTGWECNSCGFDAMPEIQNIPLLDRSTGAKNG